MKDGRVETATFLMKIRVNIHDFYLFVGNGFCHMLSRHGNVAVGGSVLGCRRNNYIRVCHGILFSYLVLSKYTFYFYAICFDVSYFYRLYKKA